MLKSTAYRIIIRQIDMEKKLFKKIWEQTVNPVIETCDEKLRKEEYKKYRVKKRNVAKVIDKAYRSYQNTREYLKTYLYDSEPPAEIENSVLNYTGRLIDYHKIGSCLCKALLDNKLYKFKYQDEMPFELISINYYLAYHSSLSFVYYYTMIAYHYMDGKLYDKLLLHKKFIGPATSKRHDNYHEGRIKVLAQCDLYQQSFDLLMYSDTLFWLETYNRQLVEAKVPLEALEFPASKDLDPLWAE